MVNVTAIHAVDKVHHGKVDSSVLYIPVCPITKSNIEYVKQQRNSFLAGIPGPDFPGGKGEAEHIGRPSESDLRSQLSITGLRAMGMERLVAVDGDTIGAKEVVNAANDILGFSEST